MIILHEKYARNKDFDQGKIGKITILGLLSGHKKMIYSRSDTYGECSLMDTSCVPSLESPP